MIIIVINEYTEKCQKYNTIDIFISLFSNNFRYSITVWNQNFSFYQSHLEGEIFRYIVQWNIRCFKKRYDQFVDERLSIRRVLQKKFTSKKVDKNLKG